jgi:hypothetical protein
MPTRCGQSGKQQMADTGGPTHDPGLEGRVARLEADVAHMRGDVAEIKATLNRIAQHIHEVRGFMKAKWPEFASLDDPRNP